MSSNRSHDLLRTNNGAGIIRHIDVESGLHLCIRVIRRRIPYHRHFVAKLSGEANNRFNAGMRYEPNNDELMDTMLLELQIQICVGEATRTQMLIRRLKLAHLHRLKHNPW